MPGRRRRGGSSSDSDAAARPAKRQRRGRVSAVGITVSAGRAKPNAPLPPFDAARAALCSERMKEYWYDQTGLAGWRRHVHATIKSAGLCASARGALPMMRTELRRFNSVIDAHRREMTGLQRVHVQALLPCACTGACSWRVEAPTNKPACALVRRDGHAHGTGARSASAADLAQHLVVRIVRAVGPRRQTLQCLAQIATALRAAALSELPQLFVDYDLQPDQVQHSSMAAVQGDARRLALVRQPQLLARLLERPMECINALSPAAVYCHSSHRPWMYRRINCAVPSGWRDLYHGAPSVTTLALLGHSQLRTQTLFGCGQSWAFGLTPASIGALLWQLDRLEGGAQAEIVDAVAKASQRYAEVFTANNRAEVVRQASSIVLKSPSRGRAVVDAAIECAVEFVRRVSATLDKLIQQHLVPLEWIDNPEGLCPRPELRLGNGEPLYDGSTWNVQDAYSRHIQPYVYARSVEMFGAVRAAAGAGAVELLEGAERSLGGRALLKGMSAQMGADKFNRRTVERLWPTFERALRAIL